MRIAPQGFLRDADFAGDLDNPAQPFFSILDAVNPERCIEYGADALARIERSERILKDHLNGTTHGSQRRLLELADVRPVETDRALAYRSSVVFDSILAR
jgi:hypothetical protein